MNQQNEKTKEIFATVLQDIPNHQKCMNEEIDTATFLTNLAYDWPLFIDAEQKRGLAAICRSISVSKDVKANYNFNWTRASNREPLKPKYWPVMIAVLSAQFEDKVTHDNESKGQQLKRLNAAFTAIDLAEEFDDIPHLPELRRHLKGLLNGILYP